MENETRMHGDESYRQRKMAKLVKGQRVLDIGCSDMPNPYLRADYLVGFDLSPGNLTPNYHRHVVGDVYELPDALGDEKFDVVVVGEVLEHVNDPVKFLACCSSVLREGGSIVLSTPNPHSPMETLLTLTLNRKIFYTRHHVMLYPQRWLIRVMEMAGFQDVELFSGGMVAPFCGGGRFPSLGLIPFPRAFCYQTIATGVKRQHDQTQ